MTCISTATVGTRPPYMADRTSSEASTPKRVSRSSTVDREDDLISEHTEALVDRPRTMNPRGRRTETGLMHGTVEVSELMALVRHRAPLRPRAVSDTPRNDVRVSRPIVPSRRASASATPSSSPSSSSSAARRRRRVDRRREGAVHERGLHRLEGDAQIDEAPAPAQGRRAGAFVP